MDKIGGNKTCVGGEYSLRIACDLSHLSTPVIRNTASKERASPVVQLILRKTTVPDHICRSELLPCKPVPFTTYSLCICTWSLPPSSSNPGGPVPRLSSLCSTCRRPPFFLCLRIAYRLALLVGGVLFWTRVEMWGAGCEVDGRGARHCGFCGFVSASVFSFLFFLFSCRLVMR